MSTSYSRPSAPAEEMAPMTCCASRMKYWLAGSGRGPPWLSVAASSWSYSSTRSRSEPGSISRPPSLPSATTASWPPGTRPCRSANAAAMRGSSAASAASARSLRSAPAVGTSSRPSSEAASISKRRSKARRRALSSASSKCRASLTSAPICVPVASAAGEVPVGAKLPASSPSSAAAFCARWSARAGAAPRMPAMRSSSAGLRCSRDSTCTPAGSRFSIASNRVNAL